MRTRRSLAMGELYFRLRQALEALGSPLRAAIEATVSMRPHNAPMPNIVIGLMPADGDFSHRDAAPLAGELRSATLPDLAIDGAGVL